VLINLLGNALKFTRRGGIQVRTSCDSSSLRHRLTIAVTDSGAGIARVQLAHIFEPFEQSQIGVREGGAGLGLAISRELARLMGGDVTARSEEGVGSTFTFTFDGGIAGESTLRALRVARIEPASRRPKILVVDDQPDNLTIADETLRGVGFETRLAMRGEEALAVVADWSPDLILMDMRMPGMNGVEVTRRLRSSGASMPVVAYTASGLADMAAEARAAGADDVVFKPCKEIELLQAVGRLLDLQYAYEEPVDDVAAADHTSQVEPLRELGAGVPAALLEELRVAAVQARLARVEQLAEEVARYAPDAAARIRKLVREFRVDELIALLRAATPGGG
jgi:CheY-like chemotaxis protein